MKEKSHTNKEKFNDEWLTPKEAASLLKIHRSTIYRWADEGLLTLYNLGNRLTRLKRAEVEKLMQPQKQNDIEQAPARQWKRSTERATKEQVEAVKAVFDCLEDETPQKDDVMECADNLEVDLWQGCKSIAFSPDGIILASGSADDTVLLWDMGRGPESFDLLSPKDNALTSSTPSFEWEDSKCEHGLSHYELLIDGELFVENIPESRYTATDGQKLSAGKHT